jgi:8-oxo-dGTP pyrophosphatase MutT (NUDIX family)
MKKYVCCYVEDHAGRVLLIEKLKPAWQAGRFNLPGGSVEGDETAEEAATRELFEEANLQAIEAQTIGRISGDGWDVYVVRCVTPHPSRIHQKTAERVFWLDKPAALREARLIPNLRLVIPLAATGAYGWVVNEGGHHSPNQCTFELPCAFLPI